MKIFWIGFSILFFVNNVFCQHKVPFDELGIDQGLSQGFVACMFQDQEGFVWLGTVNGLNRYDGQRFVYFKHDYADSNSISSNFIADIEEFGDYLVVATTDAGLNFFHKKTQKFIRLNTFSSNPVTRSISPRINSIAFDKMGALWLSQPYLSSKGESRVTRISFPSSFWYLSPHEIAQQFQQANFREWTFKALTFMIKGIETPIIKLNEVNFLKFDTKNDSWEEVLAPSGKKMKSLSAHGQSECMVGQDIANEIWGTKDGRAWKSFGVYPARPLWVLDSHLWVRKGEEILGYRFNAGTVNFSQPQYQLESSDDRHEMLLLAGPSIWLAHHASGIRQFLLRKTIFKQYFPGESITKPPFETPSGNFIIYFYPNKFVSAPGYDPCIRAIDRHIIQKGLYIVSYLPDQIGNLWIIARKDSQYPAILFKLDMKSGKMEEIPTPYPHPYNSGMKIDKDACLWYTGEGNLICYNTLNGNFKNFSYSYLPVNNVNNYDLTRTEDGSWWISSESGLIRGYPEGDGFRFELFVPGAPAFTRPNSATTTCLLTDPNDKGVLWIGTWGSGLNRLNTRTGRFTYIGLKDGLPDDVIYGILPDEQGYLWVSTNRGLVQYDVKTGKMRNYRKSDGLQSNEFNFNAYAKGIGNKLLFAGVNGLNVFNPASINIITESPRVAITQIAVNNQIISPLDSTGLLKLSLEYTNRMVLEHDQNNIEFEFAALEYLNPTKNRYRFYLEGAEEPWCHETYEARAAYFNLRPGVYTFKVMGANSDGVWNPEPISLVIVIRAAWYATKLAYFLYCLFAFGLIYWYIRIWKYRQNLARELERERFEAQLQAIKLSAERREAEHVRQMDRLHLEKTTQELLQKSQMVANLLTQLDKVSADLPESGDLEKLYTSQILTQKDWEVFQMRFDKVYPGYLRRLEKQFPYLTPSEVRLIALGKLNLELQDASALLGISLEAIKKTKYRLRKKLEGNGKTLSDLEGFK